jgi:hypothetical protein
LKRWKRSRTYEIKGAPAVDNRLTIRQICL